LTEKQDEAVYVFVRRRKQTRDGPATRMRDTEEMAGGSSADVPQ